MKNQFTILKVSGAVLMAALSLSVGASSSYANPYRRIGFKIVKPENAVLNIGGESDEETAKAIAGDFEARAAKDGHSDYFKYYFACESTFDSDSGAKCETKDMTNGLGFKVSRPLDDVDAGKVFMFFNTALGRTIKDGEIECVVDGGEAFCTYSHLHLL